MYFLNRIMMRTNADGLDVEYRTGVCTVLRAHNCHIPEAIPTYRTTLAFTAVQSYEMASGDEPKAPGLSFRPSSPGAHLCTNASKIRTAATKDSLWLVGSLCDTV